MRRSSLVLSGLIFFLFLSSALGQTATPLFSIRVSYAGTQTNLADGGTVAMNADALNVGSNATVMFTYRGTSTVSINSIDLSGSNDFSLGGPPELPATVDVRNTTLGLNVRFQPTSSQRLNARLLITYNEGRVGGTITVNFTGTAPEFAYSYIPQGGNSTVIQPTGTITFPVTAVNATSGATVVLTNRGTGPGVVNSIGLTGAAEFLLAGVPLPATTVDAGKELKFGITFTPKQLPVVKATLVVELFNQQLVFSVEGTASGPVWAYDQVQDSSFVPINTGQTLSLPDALIGEKSSIVVRFRNVGNAEGKITAISVAGAGFTLTDSPFLPLTLQSGGNSVLAVTFTPTQPGRVSGRLRIGDDSFDITGNGLGATLSYAYVVSSVITTVQSNGSAIFTPVAVGGTSTLRFQVSNTGTAPTSIGSISIIQTGTIFALANVPALPLTIQPNATIGFNVSYAPTVQGAASATLRLDTLSFTLSGTGNPPAALPEYRYESPGATVEPQAQVAVGLLLNAAYPLALSGTLTMAFNSEVFSNDPAVQFAVGGRTVTFTIPANSTRAVFQNNQQQIRIQTGTVAGQLILTPSFVTDGGINLTPTTPPALMMSVTQSAPRLLSVQLSSKTASVITLLVTGYATNRSVTQMDFQFAPVAGENVTTSRISANVDASFIAWYNSVQSTQFGSLFTATVPFTVAGDTVNVVGAAETIKSISVTLTNRLGASPARTIELK